jgi:TPR repeat protein
MNKHEAARLYRAAALQGYAPAQYSLGYCCFRGIGVAFNEEEGIRLYKIAALQGYGNALFLLGKCYFDGSGVEQNRFIAEWLFKMAADCGYQYASNGSGLRKRNLKKLGLNEVMLADV